MEFVARVVVLTMLTAIVLFGIYIGVRTTRDPVWIVRWRNRLNGDPRDYPPELRDQWWARWNAAVFDPERVEASVGLRWEYRLFGIFILALSTVCLVALIDSKF